MSREYNRNRFYLFSILALLSLPLFVESFLSTHHQQTTLISTKKHHSYLFSTDHHDEGDETTQKSAFLTAEGESFTNPSEQTRRVILSSFASSMIALSGFPSISRGADAAVQADTEVQLVASGDAKQLFNEGRVLEMQGNLPAAQRIYLKVTKIAPRFVYGWSNLGNTQVGLGSLDTAEQSYNTAIGLCNESLEQEARFGVRRCNDLYLLLLNRGALRLNNNMPKEALQDLEQAASVRGKPDAVILQNRARAREINNMYAAADRDYSVAISMTSNEVSPYWLRSAMVKYQLGDLIGALDLIRRVEVRFPEAPEVRAALAALLMAKGDSVGAQRKYLEIPDKARMKFLDEGYLKETIVWPPAMIESLEKVAKAVGDG